VIRDYEPLGELEAAVMEVVWKHAPVTAREVCDRMKGRWERAYTTIMTTMDRLFRKGLLRRQKEGLAWQYHPVLTAQQFDRALADSLASRILSADQDTALHAFVDAAAKVDVALLERLRQLIDQKGKRAR
jgi:BlaI family transcriptional regulator, penicillinase repressor